jgi:hypothetical protein
MAGKGDNSNGRRAILEVLEELESLEAEKATVVEKIKACISKAVADNVAAGGVPVSKQGLKQLIKERRADMEKTAALRAEIERIRKALGDFEDTELGEWAKASAAAITSARNTRAPRIKTGKDRDLPLGETSH